MVEEDNLPGISTVSLRPLLLLFETVGHRSLNNSLFLSSPPSSNRSGNGGFFSTRSNHAGSRVMTIAPTTHSAYAELSTALIGPRASPTVSTFSNLVSPIVPPRSWLLPASAQRDTASEIITTPFRIGLPPPPFRG